MGKSKIYSIKKLTSRYDVPRSFLLTVCEYELIQVTEKDNDILIPDSELHRLEQIIRLYEQLGINLEGIDVILQLNQKIKEQQEIIRQLRNKLTMYDL